MFGIMFKQLLHFYYWKFELFKAYLNLTCFLLLLNKMYAKCKSKKKKSVNGKSIKNIGETVNQ
jgi:hypothetical protein